MGRRELGRGGDWSAVLGDAGWLFAIADGLWEMLLDLGKVGGY